MTTPFATTEADRQYQGVVDTSVPRFAAEPMRYFDPTARTLRTYLHEFWKHRELLWTFAVRDLKLRYRQTVVGVAWAVVQPLALCGIFVLLFGLLGRTPASGEVPYALVAFTGLLPWQLFAGTVTIASGSLVANQALIGKIYFPRLIFPIAAGMPGLIDLTIGLMVLLGMLATFGVALGWTVLLAPVFAALVLLSAFAIGVWAAALNAIYRDVGILMPFGLQIGLFVTPVLYESSTLIPPRWRAILALNPVAGPVEGFRWSMLGSGPPPLVSIALSLGVTVAVLLTGLMYFRRVERFLADRI